MKQEIDKHFLKLFSLGILRPWVRYSGKIRRKILESVNYNTGLIPNQLIDIDLLTDSLMHFVVPERSFTCKSHIESLSISVKERFKKYFGYKYVLPVAQGRMAEALLAKLKVRNAMIIPSNGLFITTRIHQELSGATVLEFPIREAYDLTNDFPFKGNLDTKKLEEAILEYTASWIPFIYVETCVNATGGHPVSMKNIKEVNRIAKAYEIPVILDACRILENAYLIKEREEGHSHKSVAEIVREFCSFTDGCTMSASKDFFVETGGFLAVNNEKLYYQAQDAITVFGDGLSVKIKAGLNDALERAFRDASFTKERVKKVYYLWHKLKKFGLPVLYPSGGHAVFLDVKKLYEILPVQQYPEKAFLVSLYLSSGIRAGENILTPYQKNIGFKMLRLTIPTRMYSYAQMDYVAASLNKVWRNKERINGLRKIYQPPSLSGSYFAEYELMGNSSALGSVPTIR